MAQKTAAAFTELDVRPHTTDKLPMSPGNRTGFKKRMFGRRLPLACSAGMQEEAHRDAAATDPGPDGSRSQWRRGVVHHCPPSNLNDM